MNYLVHIGYPKAASTWLQTILFSGIDPRIQPLKSDVHKTGDYQKSGANLFFNKYKSGVSNRNIKLIHPFDFHAEDVRREIEEKSPKTNSFICLSSEAWVGHPFSGGVTAHELANRIKKTPPDAKILIVIRRQKDAILSAYSDFLTRAGGICSLDRFLNSEFQDQISSHSPYYYCYDSIVSCYSDLFGQKNVLVLPFEILSEKGAVEFLSAIYSFLELEPYKALPEMPKKNVSDYSNYAALRLLPLINLLSYPHPANGNAGMKILPLRNILIKCAKTFISKKKINTILEKDKQVIAEFIEPYARHSNHNLQKYVSFDLKELGYSF
jgi:sulfotransferase family protein